MRRAEGVIRAWELMLSDVIWVCSYQGQVIMDTIGKLLKTGAGNRTRTDDLLIMIRTYLKIDLGEF